MKMPFIVFVFLLALSASAQMQTISGNVFAQDPDGLTNYSSPDAISGKHLVLSGERIGNYLFGNEPIALYRYEVPPPNAAIAYQQSLTNAEHGKVYVQNAKSVLASLEFQQEQVASRILALSASGAVTNATNHVTLSNLQAQQSALAIKIDQQKENIRRLQEFYNLPDSQ